MRATAAASVPRSRFEKTFAGAGLEGRWAKLHKGDQEPFPSVARITRIAKQHAKFAEWLKSHGGAREVTEGVQQAWRRFHAGDFAGAVTSGSKFGALGATAANKAAGIHSLEVGGEEATRLLQAAITRGEQAIELLPDDANAHYMLALALGRYSQRISILKGARERHRDSRSLSPRHHAETRAGTRRGAHRPTPGIPSTSGRL